MGLGAVNIDIGQTFGFLNTIIEKIFPDKTQQEKAKADLIRLEMEGQLDQFKQQLQVFVNESSSPDKWTSRARPSFLYVMYIFILCGIPMGVLAVFSKETAMEIAAGMRAWLGAIPTSLWAVFGASFSVYTIARSYDKGKEIS